MARHLDRAQIVGQIYDAALDPAGWSALPRLFAEIADGGSGIVAVLRATGEVEATTYDQPDEAGQQYSAYYRFVNPLDPIVSSIGPMAVRRDSDLMPVLEYRQTEFYTDFAHKFRTDYLVGTSFIPIAPGVVGQIGLHREGSRDFRLRRVALVQEMVPHLQRAMQLRLRLGLTQAGTLGFAALDTLAVGCVICDATGGVVYANRAAEALDGVGAEVALGGVSGIAVRDPTTARTLARLIAGAAGGGSGGPLFIGSSTATGVLALVAPLPSRLGGVAGHALVTLRPATDSPRFSANLLADMFGLTPAEARLALALAGGSSLKGFSEERAVTENTVRSQLAGVLRKTGAGNQRELVRLLGLLPPVVFDRS